MELYSSVVVASRILANYPSDESEPAGNAFHMRSLNRAQDDIMSDYLHSVPRGRRACIPDRCSGFTPIRMKKAGSRPSEHVAQDERPRVSRTSPGGLAGWQFGGCWRTCLYSWSSQLI